MDLFGPVAYLVIGGNKYGLVIVDDYSYFTWILFLHDKCQVQEKVKIFVRRAQKEFGLPIKKVRSNNGTEFKNTLVEEFLDEEGIKHEFSTPYTPQQNGVVERKNHTPLNKVEVPQAADEQSSTNVPDAEGEPTPNAN